MTDTLLPCPFCGSKPKIVKGSNYTGDIKKPIFTVVCKNPNCQIYDGYCRFQFNEGEAIRNWNKRLII